MKISIITTVYNAKDDIRPTIESVLSQEGVDVEYIITDGGSTDGTLDVIAEYPEVQLYSEPDTGIYDGMNKGIRRASGELIGILNAADTYEPGVLAAMVKAAKDHSEAGVFHGQMQWILNGEVKDTVGQAVPENPIRKRMIVCHPTTFIRKTTYEKYGLFDDSYKIAADHKMMHCLQSQGVKFCFLDRVIAQMEGGGASAQHRKIKRDEVLRTLQDYGSRPMDVAKVHLAYHAFSLKDKVKQSNLVPTKLGKLIFRQISKIIK